MDNRSQVEPDADPVDVDDQSVEDVPSYADHMIRCEKYADELTEILRQRGFHYCEAAIFCNWQGLVVLSKTTITNGMGPQGPIQIMANCVIPLPWRLPPDKRVAAGDALTHALAGIEQGTIQQCAKQKVLALNYATFVKKMSTTIATATTMPTNGRSRILRP